MKRHLVLSATLAAMMAVMSSSAAMAQKASFLDSIEFHGYGQAGFSYDDQSNRHTNGFNLKRTLLWAKAHITDRWSFQFMHDFNSVVQEYYTDYRFSNDKSFSVRLGQFKHSFSMENPMSPTQLELIDVYSQAVLYLAGEGPDPLFGVNYGRDLGMMFYGDLFNNHLHYELAVMNGEGVNCKDKNEDKDFIARLEVRPVEHLRFVVSGQKGKGHARDTVVWNPSVKKGDDYRRDRVSVGAEYKTDVVSLRGEYLAGKDGEVKSQGAYLTGRVTVAPNFDLIGSVDYYDFNTSNHRKQTNYTAGVQYWLYKKCRVQLQYTRCQRGFADNYNWLQGQLQVAF